MVMTVVYGAQLSFSVFLKPISQTFDWTRTSTSGAFAINLWVSGLLAVFTGVLTDKYGPRVVIVTGAIVGSLGYLLLSGTDTIWHLYLGFVLVSASTSTAWTPIITTVSRWFNRKRVLALGIVTAGIGLGQIAMPPLAAYLIEENGWRTTYIVLAIIVCLIVVPSAMLSRHSPHDKGLLPDGITSSNNADKKSDMAGTTIDSNLEWSVSEVIKTRVFWLLLALNMVVAITLFMAGIHIPAYATDYGIATTSAAFILTFMGSANILSKLIAGAIATKIPTKNTALMFMVLEAIALFWFATTQDLWLFFIIATIFGLGIGGSTPLIAALVPEFFGLRSLGTITGILGVGWAVGCAIGTLLGDYVFDITGSYSFAFILSGVTAVVGLLIVTLLKIPQRS